MISVLIVVLVSSSVQCFDWCPLVKPNGVYEGLGFYHRFADIGIGDYVMFNRAGHEWMAKILSTTNHLTITLMDTSVKSVEDKGVINKFGTFALYEPSLQKPGGRPRDCSVITTGQRFYQIICRGAQQNGLNSSGSTDFVIMKVRAKPTTKEQAECLIFQKESNSNKSYYFVFNPFTAAVQIDCSLSQEESCKIPLFVQQMDDSLFTKIDAVVDFRIKKGPTGHLILFNIDGRPKYCTTLEEQPLSDECKSPENMKTLFDECFRLAPDQSGDPSKLRTTESNESIEEKNKSSGSLFIFVIIAIVVIIILAIIVSLVVYNRRAKSVQNKDEIKPTDKPSAKPEGKNLKSKASKGFTKTSAKPAANSPKK